MSAIAVPADPPADQVEWSAQLQRIANQPLEFCEQFPRIAARHEAWWAGELDTPLIFGATVRDTSHTGGRLIELIDEPGAWLEAKIADLANLDLLGDTLPGARVDFGPACISGMLGGERVIESDTAWTEPFIDDNWSNAPDWQLDESNSWWRRLCILTDMLAEAAARRFIVIGPDLGGASDALLSMRGSEGLCMDAITQPNRITDAMDAIYPVWWRVSCELYARCLKHDAGVMFWLGLWSSQPYTTLTCDFNFMIGPDQFRAVCLPDIQRACATFSRSVIHVDGPQAVRHIAALCELPELDAIQYTPGAATPSPLPHVAALRAAQDAGKSLLVCCPTDQAVELAEQLRPTGLAIILDGQPECHRQVIEQLQPT